VAIFPTVSAHSIGYDGVHLWCDQHRLVVVDPCGWWQREPGCDEAERKFRERRRRSLESRRSPETTKPARGGLRVSDSRDA